MDELPLGAISEPSRIDSHRRARQGPLYGFEEAADRYGISVSTLRRRLSAGQIEGAFKLPGPKGEMWQIPGASLTALGYQPVEAVSAPDPAPPVVDVGRVLGVLEEAFANAQRQLEAGEQDRRLAEERAETERRARTAEIEAARLGERVVSLERELTAARRRWWRGMEAADFKRVGEVEVDNRRCISLGRFGDPDHTRYFVEASADGEIRLVPAVSSPAREMFVWQRPGLLASIREASHRPKPAKPTV